MLLLSVRLPTASSMLPVSPQLEAVSMSFAVALPVASLDVAYTAASSANCDSVNFTHASAHALYLTVTLASGHFALQALITALKYRLKRDSARVHPWRKPLSTSILSVVVSLTPISACMPS